MTYSSEEQISLFLFALARKVKPPSDGQLLLEA